MRRNEFLSAVVEYVKGDPEAAPEIVAACSHGVGLALKESLERACDMEVALASALMKRDFSSDRPLGQTPSRVR